MIFNPSEVGWHLGRAHEPPGRELWVPWDRTAGVIGPQGSGKTLDLLIPALLSAPGAALVTLTKVDDLLLSFPVRSRDGRPCLVLDPFGLVNGLPELVWDPVAGCVDPMVAERRAKAIIAGTIKAALGGGYGDDAARFYAAEAAKVIQASSMQPRSRDAAWTMCCVGWRTRRTGRDSATAFPCCAVLAGAAARRVAR
jgi:type IV secretion system protein VirD4